MIKRKMFVIILIILSIIISFGGCINKPGLKNLKIIFESSRNVPNDASFPQKYIELYMMDSDGSNVKRITYNLYWEHKPQVSPDGQKILVTIHFSPESVEETDPGWEIAIMNIDGSGLVRLTNNSYLDANAKWNKDGTKIVFVSDSNHRTVDDLEKGLLPQYDIYIMNPDGTEMKKLTFGERGEINADPCFSIEDNIYYIHSMNYSNNFDLWEMKADGSNKHPVFTHNELIKAINDPSVSIDGKRIVFEGKINEDLENPNYNLFMIDANGSNLTRITYDDGESDIWPSFSPNGLYIVYFTYKWDGNGGHTQEMRISRYDGSGEKKISNSPWDSFPSWFKK